MRCQQGNPMMKSARGITNTGANIRNFTTEHKIIELPASQFQLYKQVQVLGHSFLIL